MLDVFMITTGSMIAAGLFVLPGIAFARWLSISLKCAYALLGIKFVGMAQVALTSALICVLTYLAVGGIGSINTAYFEPFSPVGFGPVLSTAGFIFISYGGMLAITGPIYTIVVFVIVGNLEASVLINTLTPVADTAGIVHGRMGVLLASLAALLAFVTTANAGIASASRYSLAMSRDRLLPNILLKLHFNNGMPAVSILLTGFFILVAIIFLELEALVEIASSLLMLTYILTNLTVIALKYQVNKNYQPTFHAPLKPWLQVLSIAGLLLLITQVSFMAIIVNIIFCMAAYIWYLMKAKQLPENIIPLPPKPKKS